MKVLDYRPEQEAKRNLHELASDVSDLFGLLVNRQRAVTIHIEQVLADQVLVVDESRAADHLSSCGFCSGGFVFVFVVVLFLTSVRL